ncbi:MAG TPA: DUF362 domain-containing protein [Anaerohalosphaeraceae bacterium]|nr:DUF362 domain-containing protein [Anaerohalosphaeraceae bacterium]HOL88423.1 DUF362 domain-containing protein [Anaerohalosphaeraceae bacterium]HPP57295.1 DUF362 domain-containing protein [Anaerohalosphaeraceae bacterium]
MSAGGGRSFQRDSAAQEYPVVLCRCSSYEASEVREALERFWNLAGGIGKFVRPSDRVLIKPNLIVPSESDKAAQTHPAVIAALAQMMKEAGAKPMVGDSPAWGDVRTCLKALQIDTVLDSMQVPMVQLDRAVRVKIDGASVGISRAALEADIIINLPKFKTHQQLGATFAVKNIFGCVVGKEKPLWHFLRGGDAEAFCRLLLGIYRYLSPAVNLVDAVIAMEGQGPISGSPRHLGYFIGGTDPIACEYACCRLVGLEPMSLPILRTAAAINFGCPSPERITVLGDPLPVTPCPDFRFAQQTPLRFTLPRICKSVAKQALLLLKNRLG